MDLTNVKEIKYTKANGEKRNYSVNDIKEVTEQDDKFVIAFKDNSFKKLFKKNTELVNA